MRKELDDALCRDFPNVFRNRDADMSTTAMCWGFECGDGWEPIIREAAAKIEAEIAKLTPEEYPEAMETGAFAASQVKEKYGTLRFYLHSGNDACWTATAEAAEKSAVTCEQCGGPGEMRGEMWFYVACDEHTKERDK